MVFRLCLRAGLSTPALARREGTAAAPSVNVSLLGQVLPTLGTLCRGTRIASPAGAPFGMELALLWAGLPTSALARREGTAVAPSLTAGMCGQVFAALAALLCCALTAHPVGAVFGMVCTFARPCITAPSLARRERTAVTPGARRGQLVQSFAAPRALLHLRLLRRLGSSHVALSADAFIRFLHKGKEVSAAFPLATLRALAGLCGSCWRGCHAFLAASAAQLLRAFPP